jgi:hypothetical protein
MKAQQANLELGRPDELDLWSEGVSTMGIVYAIERDDADRLLTHMASEHGIPVSIAQRIPGPALAKLCRDDQAQDFEDRRPW